MIGTAPKTMPLPTIMEKILAEAAKYLEHGLSTIQEPRLIGPGKRTIFTIHKKIGTSRYNPRSWRNKGYAPHGNGRAKQ